MRNIHKNLILFVSLAFLLSSFIFLASQKFFTILLQKGITSCQEILNTVSLPIPHNTSTVLHALVFVLLAVSLLKFFVSLVKMYHFQFTLSKNVTSDATFSLTLNKLNLFKKTVLIESDKPFGFCFGLKKPKIYISTAAVSLLTPMELTAVLIHEEAHLRNHDTYTLYFASLIQSFFPFFPLFTDILHNFRLEREIKADQAVLHRLHSPKPLLSALEKLLTREVEPSVVFAPAVADAKTLEKRITFLQNKQFTYSKVSVVNLLVSFVFFFILLGTLFIPLQAVEVHHEKHDMIILATQNEVKTSACHLSTPFSVAL